MAVCTFDFRELEKEWPAEPQLTRKKCGEGICRFVFRERDAAKPVEPANGIRKLRGGQFSVFPASSALGQSFSELLPSAIFTPKGFEYKTLFFDETLVVGDYPPPFTLFIVG